MGRPDDIMDGPQTTSSQENTKATFSGTTALVGVIALIISIISVAVPYWGYYGPAGASYYASGLASQDNTGNFGPFQTCKNVAYYTYCGGSDIYKPSTWILIGGISAIGSVVCLGFFSLFAILHVAMQLQRKEIMVSYPRAIFLKGVTACVAVLTCLAGTILGALEFTIGRRNAPFELRMGVCYYLQIVLIFASGLLAFLSYVSYKKYRKNPHLQHIVPRSSSSAHHAGSYEGRGGNGTSISVTQSSGSPYIHGKPRQPIQQQPQTQIPQNPGYQLQYPNYNFSTGGGQSFQQAPQMINGATVTGYALQPGQPGLSTNGFTSVQLSVPTTSVPMPMLQNQQPLPVQPIRPVQPVQGVPQVQIAQPVTTTGTLGRSGQGVSFTPGGRTNAGYNKMSSGPKGAGSMESLDSTQSLTLSTYSYGSSTSTGSGHGPLRSSLKKPKQRDIASVSSRTSSKQVRISLGAEQTTV